MSFHHVAIASRDIEATHRFYTDAMGFELVKAVVAPTEQPGGWAKHLFYDTGDGYIAFWDLHDEAIGAFDPAISTGLGLPAFVNHLAFRAVDREDLERRRDQWLGHGHDVVELDHDFCVSIYATDPNGILVEWCCDSRPLTAEERARALEILNDPAPPQDEPPAMQVYRARQPDAEPVAPVPAT
jgi:catechol 2,3-dioxygenase-like lactoylglutathione lyase family enzyme